MTFFVLDQTEVLPVLHRPLAACTGGGVCSPRVT